MTIRLFCKPLPAQNAKKRCSIWPKAKPKLPDPEPGPKSTHFLLRSGRNEDVATSERSCFEDPRPFYILNALSSSTVASALKYNHFSAKFIPNISSRRHFESDLHLRELKLPPPPMLPRSFRYPSVKQIRRRDQSWARSVKLGHHFGAFCIRRKSIIYTCIRVTWTMM